MAIRVSALRSTPAISISHPTTSVCVRLVNWARLLAPSCANMLSFALDDLHYDDLVNNSLLLLLFGHSYSSACCELLTGPLLI